MWCWAASGQMIMSFLAGSNITQCQEASNYFGNSSCCNSPTPDACVNGAWPQFDQYGFSFQRTAQQGTGGVPLTWDELRQEIDAGRPVAFSYHFLSGGGHMMVARGYQVMSGKNYVMVNDPWPPNVGAQYPVQYETWAAGPSGDEHWFDFYNIRATGAGGVGGSGPGGSGSIEVPGGPNVRTLAESAAEDFKLTAIQLAGKDVPGAAEQSYLATSLPVVRLGLDQLASGAPGGNPLEEIHEAEVNKVISPVMIKDQLQTSVVTEKQKDQSWLAGVANPAWTKILVDVRAKHAAINSLPLDAYFVVDCAALGVYFLGVRIGGKLRLVVTVDDPALGKAADELSSDKAFEVLSKIARTHSGNPA
jgi:hypothetical protein